MKKIFLMMLLFSISFVAEARISVEPIWGKLTGEEIKKTLKITCDKEDPYICDDICSDQKECVVPEGICKNCIGNNLFVTNFYKNVGLGIVNSGKFFDRNEIVSVVNRGDFITLTANSIYNTLTEFGSKKMKAQFAKLCPWTTKNGPTVFARVDKDTREPISFEYVFCDSTPYELTDRPTVYEREAEEDLGTLVH